MKVMMSPFGVQYQLSEVSKARRFRKISPEATARIQAQQAKRQARNVKIGAAARKVADVPKQITNTKVSINDIGRGVGFSTAKVGTSVGRVLSAKPGITGGAVLGGTGYALWRHGNKPKKTVSKSAFGVEHVEKAIRFPGVKPFGPGAAKYTGDAEKHLLGLKKVGSTKKPVIGGGKIHTDKGKR